MPEPKEFVLDTSVLMHDPRALESFEEHTVVIPIWVIEELDRLKTRPDERGATAREASQRLERYRQKGSLRNGVDLDCGGRLIVDYRGMRNRSDRKSIPLSDTADNRIISVAVQRHEEAKKTKEKKVILVSKDVNMRLKADAYGIEAQDYETDKKIRSIGELNSGIVHIHLAEDPVGILQKLWRDTSIPAKELLQYVSGDHQLVANSCCVIKDTAGKRSYAMYNTDHEGPHFTRVQFKDSDDHRKNGVVPINYGQAFAFAMLMDPRIPLVSLVGQAGTGKTLMALLAAYQLERSDMFDGITVFRPNIEIGERLGFLPGDRDEKFKPWMRPVYDAMSLILRGNAKHVAQKQRHGNGSRSDDEKPELTEYQIIDDMITHGRLEILPINYVRGTTLNRRFIIVDECQNYRPLDVKTIITRAGGGSKVVLTGDLEQIDNPRLDALSNGIVHVVERFHGQEEFGHIVLEKPERSRLSELGARLL